MPSKTADIKHLEQSSGDRAPFPECTRFFGYDMLMAQKDADIKEVPEEFCKADRT